MTRTEKLRSHHVFACINNSTI